MPFGSGGTYASTLIVFVVLEEQLGGTVLLHVFKTTDHVPAIPKRCVIVFPDLVVSVPVGSVIFHVQLSITYGATVSAVPTNVTVVPTSTGESGVAEIFTFFTPGGASGHTVK